jgi:hypothetical protein
LIRDVLVAKLALFVTSDASIEQSDPQRYLKDIHAGGMHCASRKMLIDGDAADHEFAEPCC